MNCQQGDLAIVFKGEPAINIGRVVRLTRLAPPVPGDCFYEECGPFWYYEGDLVGGFGNRASAVADDCLKPLPKPDQVVGKTLSLEQAT